MGKLSDSTGNFKYAIEGVVHVYRTQKHMRFHLLALILAGVFSLILKLSYIEMLAIVISISFVIFAEMINTAVEAVVDLVTQNYHPLAKIAKDIAAGAVLVATLNAIIVGILVVFNRSRIDTLNQVYIADKPNLVLIAVVGIAIMLSIVVMYKVAGNKGKVWKGGVISVHSALGFFMAWTTFFLEDRYAIAIVALCLAALVAQSRVEGGIHTVSEVIWGAIVATAIVFLAFMVFAPIF